jgi:hypothetical protein
MNGIKLNTNLVIDAEITTERACGILKICKNQQAKERGCKERLASGGKRD